MFKKILVCADGSACSEAAAQVAAQIAAHFKADALALNVYDPTFLTTMGGWEMAVGQDVMDDYAKAQEESVTTRVAPLFAARGLPCRMMQELGHPVGSIVSVARREKADLVVVGSRGLCGLKELFLGSVSSGVLHHAPCAVLIVRGENAPHNPDGFRRILLASDGSKDACKATLAAVALAQGFATSLTVLDVFDPSLYPLADVAEANPDDSINRMDLERYAAHEFEGIEKSARAYAGEAGVYCDVQHRSGHAAKTIVAFADEQKSDLIVVGSRGMGGFEEMLVGSVSSYVAHHAPCPVLVMR